MHSWLGGQMPEGSFSGPVRVGLVFAVFLGSSGVETGQLPSLTGVDPHLTRTELPLLLLPGGSVTGFTAAFVEDHFLLPGPHLLMNSGT